jgi:hypothetical protein
MPRRGLHLAKADIPALERGADFDPLRSCGPKRSCGAATRRRLTEQSAMIARGGTASMNNTPNCASTAGASGGPDPIFAAIERDRAALRGWLAAYDRLGEKWNDRAFPAADEELDKALEAVLSISPTTIAGVADLFDYIGRDRCQPVGPILNHAFHHRMPMIAATLPRGVTGEPDPIFASIERHRAAVRGSLAAIDRRWRLRQIIPEARRRWESNEKPLRCRDAPEWIEANTALIESYEELNKALEVVLSTPPTTIAGVADLLDYVGREEWEVAGAPEWANEYSGTILENAFEGDDGQRLVEIPACIVEGVRKAAGDFLPMIAATLRSLTAESTSR